ncbi:MAG TPA: ATPase domain-containing protein [Burkholderiales bacterium]|nr:ATPase domain-containing protein [Burkholderiales bacterium]
MNQRTPRAATGIAGLDDILGGGLTAHRLYLVEGMPGSGKTTLAFQFLMEGVRRGERVLYITLSETEAEIRDVAASHAWNLDGIDIRELVPSEDTLLPGEQYTMFHPSEVELSETTKKILADVEEVKPSRLVFDSLSELRLLAGNALRYRRQILALKQFFSGRRCTVLLLDDLTASEHDLQVQSIAHGALLLEHTMPRYGLQQRRVSVTKYRGSDFRGGYHDYVIRRGGIEVFPRLIASEHRATPQHEYLGSGVAELDALMGGGIERGTSTLLLGPAGTGKSTIAALFASNAGKRGERASLFLFDESPHTLYARMKALGRDLQPYVEAGFVKVRQIDPAQLSPGQFAHLLREAVDRDRAAVIVIDSLNGYLQSMPDERFLVAQLHELLSYLGQQGVATILINAHQGLMGPMQASVDASYVADGIVLLRYFEVDGEVRQAVSVIKKRGGTHERSIREFRMRHGGITVSEPLRDYIGVLTGVPEKKGK